jgi:hypothetical protein
MAITSVRENTDKIFWGEIQIVQDDETWGHQ